MSNLSVEMKLWRGALIPSSVVGILGLILATLLRGQSGLIGALFAQFIVLIFFAIHLLVSKFSNNLEPMMVMVLAMTSYFAKVLTMGVFLLVLMKNTNREFLDRQSFAIVAIAITMAWLAGEIRAFLKLRLTMPLPKRD
ncbi:MAG: hypothetical protein F2699_04565 [Actinobacteria bacterium]|uniref:Unannotated protein n=1 Tax=freshwater metagenome TaxID=449393 RepID=A0A6J6THC9_9ZZZZ|nr:hypothetical protein [Actinomycetota bacterium]MSX44595.1 hypothetical protein [Actinomycetota bacterium]MSZ00402.1 hypothetical protein [Actinomycetota bacterium]MTA23923.1 hypothetical protein [Actinomycetota bacterium]